MSIAKYFDLYFKLISAGVRAQLQYRFAFVMRIVGLITSYTGTAVTMWIMLYQFQELGSWTFYEMLFLFAVAVLSWGFCLSGIIRRLSASSFSPSLIGFGCRV